MNDRPERERQQPDALVLVGKVTRPQALRGWFRVLPEADDLEVFAPGRDIWMAARNRSIEAYRIEHVEIRQRIVLLKVAGIDSIEAVEPYRGQLIYLDQETLPPLPEDSFYYFELAGCRVILEDESELGIIHEVQAGSGGDLIVVRQGDREILIPAAREFVKSVSIAEKIVVVELPEGLI